jgi:hypothetical protein
MDDKQYNKLNSMYEKSFGINKQSFMYRYNRDWKVTNQHVGSTKQMPNGETAMKWWTEIATKFTKDHNFSGDTDNYLVELTEYIQEKHKREGNEQQLDIDKANKLANKRYWISLAMSAIAILVSILGLIMGLL